jgi:hypothetical protein
VYTQHVYIVGLVVCDGKEEGRLAGEPHSLFPPWRKWEGATKRALAIKLIPHSTAQHSTAAVHRDEKEKKKSL